MKGWEKDMADFLRENAWKQEKVWIRENQGRDLMKLVLEADYSGGSRSEKGERGHSEEATSENVMS